MDMSYRPIHCRECEEWYTTAQWKGNCRKHPWKKDKSSESASPNAACGGKNFRDKYERLKKMGYIVI